MSKHKSPFNPPAIFRVGRDALFTVGRDARIEREHERPKAIWGHSALVPWRKNEPGDAYILADAEVAGWMTLDVETGRDDAFMAPTEVLHVMVVRRKWPVLPLGEDPAFWKHETYEEILDAAQYLRKELFKRDGK